MPAGRHLPLMLLGLLVPLLLAATPAPADIRTVTNLLDTGPGSLRDTIGAAQPGDVIDFMPGLSGTITLGSPIDVNGLTISGPGASVLRISGGHATRHFAMSGATTLENLTIADGFVTGSSFDLLGAITYPEGSGPHVVRDCRFEGNESKGWGAI